MATPSMTPEEIRRKIEQLSNDIALLRGFVHGDEQTTVPLGGEDTNSLRRFMMLAQDGVDGPIERARQWAENPEGVPVDVAAGHFSALHWATKAMESATGTADVPIASPLQRGLAPAGGLPGQIYRVNADGSGYGWETGLAAPLRAGFVPSGGAAGQVYRVNADGDGYVWMDWPLATLIGKIDLLPFRVSDLAAHAPGWHFCNGDLYPVSGAVGDALFKLPDNYKEDWGIAIDGENISIPNMFYLDGRGFFLRAVDGKVRQVGSVEDDQMRPIEGNVYDAGGGSSWSNYMDSLPPTSLFYKGTGARSSNASDNNAWSASASTVYINSGRLGDNYNGTETSSLNIGMTPAIYLGV